MAVVNAGEVSLASKGANPLDSNWMNSLTTVVKATETWNFTKSMQKEHNNFNMLEMRSELTSIDEV